MEYSFIDRKGLHSFTMLSILVVIMVVCQMLSLKYVELTLPSFFGISDPHAFIQSVGLQMKNPIASLYTQALGSAIGFFLLPVILYHLIFRYDMVASMGLRSIPSAKYWFTAIAIMFMAAIFIQWLVQINSAIPLPGQWQSLRMAQEEVSKLFSAYFSDKSLTRFLLLILVMALLPAIGEEVCFRGTIQKTLAQTNLGPIGAIIMSGLFFSITHAEFDNFLAIWCMGIVLGFLYYYSGCIWVNIAAHFFNNALMIAGKYAYMKGAIPTDIASINILPLYLTLPAGAIMIYGLVLMRKWKSLAPSISPPKGETLNTGT